jgi:hypothetical protein
VEDDGISSVHKAERYSGIFQMTQGINYLELHHYFEIAYNHPDFKNGDFNEDSVRITKFKLEWAGEL